MGKASENFLWKLLVNLRVINIMASNAIMTGKENFYIPILREWRVIQKKLILLDKGGYYKAPTYLCLLDDDWIEKTKTPKSTRRLFANTVIHMCWLANLLYSHLNKGED